MAQLQVIEQPRTTATVKEIAARCGVHPCTVQRALQGSSLVRPKTIAKVREVASELGYNVVANDAARRLIYSRYGKTVLNRIIALCFPGEFTTVPYFHRMFAGVCEVVNELDFDLITILNASEKTSGRLSNGIVRGVIDGVCLLIPQATEARDFIARLREEPGFGTRPIVSIIQIIPETSGVSSDDLQGGRLALGHLLGLGHRHIVHMLDDETYAGHQRLAGYRTACREYGVDPDETLRSYGGGLSYEERDVIKNTLDTMQKYPNTTAILAANDFVALSIASALQDAGYRIPEDISLVGYDDSEALLDRNLNNILTTIRLPLEDIGREATRLLLGRVTGDIKEDRIVLLPVSLIQRGSTASPRPL